MTYKSQLVRWQTIATLSLSLLASQALTADILDKLSPAHPILDQLADILHPSGIDVVRGDTGRIALGDRARIAPLRGMEGVMAGVSHKNAPWMADFIQGHIGTVAAVRNAGANNLTADAFLQLWEATPQLRRVFLSFTAADAPDARLVAKALAEKGYATFTYLNETGVKPYGADIAGRLFSQAGHHFVLDTVNARRSPGVWLESKIFKIAAGKEILYIPERPPVVGAEAAALKAKRVPERTLYEAPPLPIQQLRTDPEAVRRAGGIMFGNDSRPCADIDATKPVSVIYDARRPKDERLMLRFTPAASPGQSAIQSVKTIPIDGVTDQEVATIAAFVNEGRPVLVNLQSFKRSSVTPVPYGVRSVELHPAFVDTPLGELMIRADTLIWPVLSEGSLTYEGERFEAKDDDEAESLISLLRDLYEEEASINPTVSNINDAVRPAGFCGDEGGAWLYGIPSIDVLSEHKFANQVEQALQTSAAATKYQDDVFPLVDSEAYHAAVGTYHLAGLFNYVKHHSPIGWQAFRASLPSIQRSSVTPRVLCSNCSAQELMNWVATYQPEQP